jgi:membrane protein implicated in regulation of membrane protease activity
LLDGPYHFNGSYEGFEASHDPVSGALMQRRSRTKGRMKPSPRCAVQSFVSDDAIFICKPIDRPRGTAAMLVMPPTIGVILILFGIVLFIVDLHVISHGLLTAGGIVTLLAGGLALLGAGVPYSGVLLGALVVVAMLMGGALFGVLGSLRSLGGSKALTGKEGMIGEVGSVRSPVGVESTGWIFVHGERWRAVLAFAPEGADPRDGEPMIGVGHKVRVVGFGEGGTVQVVPAQRDYHRRFLDSKG